MLQVGERPSAAAGPGERDHLLVITGDGRRGKEEKKRVEHAKRQNNKLKADGRMKSRGRKAGSGWS